MLLLTIAIVLFVVAALLGATLLSFVLRNKTIPKALVVLHGPIAITALFVLIMYAVLYHPAPIISIVIFAIAALGGLTLLYKDLTGKKIPKPFAIGHGMLAIIGLCFLIGFAYSMM